jgi:hypothetical protein
MRLFRTRSFSSVRWPGRPGRQPRENLSQSADPPDMCVRGFRDSLSPCRLGIGLNTFLDPEIGGVPRRTVNHVPTFSSMSLSAFYLWSRQSTAEASVEGIYPRHAPSLPPSQRMTLSFTLTRRSFPSLSVLHWISLIAYGVRAH